MEKCPNSTNPYTYCPLASRFQDDKVMGYVTTIANEIKRVNGLYDRPMSSEEARLIDRYCGELTAYMDGRIKQVIEMMKGDS